MISIVWVITLVFPIVSAEFIYRKDQLFGIQYALEEDIAPSPSSLLLSGSGDQSATPSGGFGELTSSNINVIKPVSTQYGIVIEKINANAKIISNVDPVNERQYTKALTEGVAEAKGSTKPGENGNLFIFSHSADGPFNISRFNAIFYLLRELEKGDRIVVFYEGKRYNYSVFDKTVTSPSDISYFTNRYDKPVLTLQTCDPPGTLNNRLIVRAQLLGS